MRATMATRSRSGCRWGASGRTRTWRAPRSSWPRAPATMWSATRWWWTAASPWAAADAPAGGSGERLVDGPVLRTAAGDLQGADPVAQCGAALQGPALLQSEQQGAAPGVAAARGVDHRLRLHRRHQGLLAADPD